MNLIEDGGQLCGTTGKRGHEARSFPALLDQGERSDRPRPEIPGLQQLRWRATLGPGWLCLGKSVRDMSNVVGGSRRVNAGQLHADVESGKVNVVLPRVGGGAFNERLNSRPLATPHGDTWRPGGRGGRSDNRR